MKFLELIKCNFISFIMKINGTKNFEKNSYTQEKYVLIIVLGVKRRIQ